jgi:hypothetical protein
LFVRLLARCRIELLKTRLSILKSPFKTLETISPVLEAMFLYTRFCSIPSSLPHLQGPALAFQIKPRCVTGVQTPQNTRLFKNGKKSLSLIFFNIYYPTQPAQRYSSRLGLLPHCRALPLSPPATLFYTNHVIRHSKDDAAGYLCREAFQGLITLTILSLPHKTEADISSSKIRL